MIHDSESKTYNVADLIRDYAKGDKEVQAYCSQPKQDRLFNSPIEPERLNQQKKRYTQTGSSKNKNRRKAGATTNPTRKRGWGRR